MNNVQGLRSQTAGRRGDRRKKLIDCAEASIVANGFAALRARELALCVGCSVGAVYTLVVDLDELVLRVSQRTMHDLGAFLDAADQDARDATTEDRLIAWATAYRAFAEANRNRWRALFEFRMSAEKELPAWFEADRADLFTRLEGRLAGLFRGGEVDLVARRAKTLFSAVHGIVALAIEGKIAMLPSQTVDDEIAAFLKTFFAGLPKR